MTGLKKVRKKENTKTLLIDGNVLMKRSYNGAKNLFYKETHIGGIYQFYATLRKLIVELAVDKVIITWDGERNGYLRLNYYPEYKNNRPTFFDQNYEIQKLRVKAYAEDLFLRQYENPDCESDDLLAYYSLNKKQNEDVIIYTNDRDLCQLITEEVNLYLADKKILLGIGNYNWYFKHHYENAALVKIIEGCSTDNIKGIEGVTETTLINYFPEIKERKVTLEEIIEKTKGLKEEKKLKIFDAIIEGRTKGKHKGNVYEINKTIIDLHQPLLTDEAKEEVLNLVNLPLNPEGRNYKNVLKMMFEDGIMYTIPGGENGYVSFLEPFIKLSKKEKTNYKNTKLC
jgi:5'-3' exonuclease